MSPVAQWVKNITEEVMGKQPFDVGDIVWHPDGYKVKITSGQYWAEGGFSNFWHWRRVLPNGKLGRKDYHGYGWTPKPPKRKKR